MDNAELQVEPRITNYLFAKAAQEKTPLSGTFELSPVCNFSCKMCYVRKTASEVKASDRPMMRLEQWMDIARQAKEQGMLYLLLTGGEPLLWQDFWQLYRHLIQMGFLVSINTNGSLIDQKAIDQFEKFPPTRINITLYGASDKTYERLCGVSGVFEKVDWAITRLQNIGIQVKLNGSLTPHNIEDLEACTRYAKSKGLIYEAVTYMFPPLRREASMIGRNERFTPKEAAKYSFKNYRLQFGDKLYEERLRGIVKGAVFPPGLDENCIAQKDGKVHCRAGKAAFWITWDGWMTPCGMMPEPRIDMKSLMFGEAWKKLVEVSNQMKISGVCAECPNRKLCHSCAAMAMAETGNTASVPQYLCEMVQEMRQIAIKELGEWAG